jgi:outer membrane protein assembly factor BamB
MREDFVTRLQMQLRDAAEREQRRGPIRRAARSGFGPAVAAAALALIAGVVVATGGWLGGRDDAPAGRGELRVLSTTTLASYGGQLASGFGAAWHADPSAIVRVDPRTGRINGRIPTVHEMRFVTAGAGAVWAMGPAGEVLRIDPDTRRTVARIPLGVSDVGKLMTARSTVWVLMGPLLFRIDGERNTVAERVFVQRGGPGMRSGATDGRFVYVLCPDGVIERWAAGDGRSVSPVRAGLRGSIIAAADGRILLARDDGVAAIDAADGRALWQRRLGLARINQSLVAGGSLWIQGVPLGGGRDRLHRLDPATGRVLESLTLPEPGASGMAAVGGRLWIATPGGRLEIVGRG